MINFIKQKLGIIDLHNKVAELMGRLDDLEVDLEYKTNPNHEMFKTPAYTIVGSASYKIHRFLMERDAPASIDEILSATGLSFGEFMGGISGLLKAEKVGKVSKKYIAVA